LRYLYKKALCFIYPSLYEGFGILIFESFTMGCPVLLSKRSSFPEIALDAALYFNPENLESIYNTVNRVINDSKLRIDLRNKGLNRVKDFSWKKCTEETKKFYKDCI